MSAITTLQELVAPLSEEEFLTLLSERQLTRLPRLAGSRFEQLHWQAVCELIEKGAVPSEWIQLTRDRQNVPKMFLEAARANLGHTMEQGASLLLRRLNAYVPDIAVLTDSLKARTQERVTASLVVTTGQAGALPFHYDYVDLVVEQIEGSKRWRIYEPPVVNPVKGMPRQPPPRDRLAFDEVLQPGDRLLVPGGYWHECENCSARSVHVSFLFQPLSAYRVLSAVAAQIVSEEMFRRPLIRGLAEHELPATEEALKRLLTVRIGQLSLKEMLSAHVQDNDTDY